MVWDGRYPNKYEGEMKSKKNETKKGCVVGSSIMGLVVTNRMKKVKPSLALRRGSGSLTQNSLSMSKMTFQLLLEARSFLFPARKEMGRKWV